MGLALMVKQPPTTEATLEELSAVVAESNSTKVLRCPECTRPLLKDKFHPLIPVQIDRVRTARASGWMRANGRCCTSFFMNCRMRKIRN